MPTNNQEKWIQQATDLLTQYVNGSIDERPKNYREYISFLRQEIRQAKIEMEEKIIDIISTHDVGDGRYCDTGEDMEWGCRSECVEMAVKRLQEYFSNLKNNENTKGLRR